jgi:hypothetical protein
MCEAANVVLTKIRYNIVSDFYGPFLVAPLQKKFASRNNKISNKKNFIYIFENLSTSRYIKFDLTIYHFLALSMSFNNCKSDVSKEEDRENATWNWLWEGHAMVDISQQVLCLALRLNDCHSK